MPSHSAARGAPITRAPAITRRSQTQTLKDPRPDRRPSSKYSCGVSAFSTESRRLRIFTGRVPSAQGPHGLMCPRQVTKSTAKATTPEPRRSIAICTICSIPFASMVNEQASSRRLKPAGHGRLRRPSSRPPRERVQERDLLVRRPARVAKSPHPFVRHRFCQSHGLKIHSKLSLRQITGVEPAAPVDGRDGPRPRARLARNARGDSRTELADDALTNSRTSLPRFAPIRDQGPFS